MTFNLFADDTQFYLSMNNVLDTEQHLNSVMTVIKDWMDVKQLNLNEDKTEILVVGKKGNLRRLGGVQSLNVNGQTTVRALNSCCS